MNSSNGNLEMATIGGGCFWCLEPIFDELKGIENVEVGYSGGQVPHPTYEQVCDGNTGHAEVVNISFRSEEIFYMFSFRYMILQPQIGRGPMWDSNIVLSFYITLKNRSG